jgi:uncharacterized membrane protein
MEETKKPAETPAPANKPASEKKINVLAMISYLGVLCLIPYLSKEADKFAKFHSKQGLVLFLFEIASWTIMFFIPFMGFIIANLIGLLWVVLSVIGILNVINNAETKLPVIGDLAEKF